MCSHQHPLCLHTHHPFLPRVQPHCSVVKVTAHPTLTSPSFPHSAQVNVRLPAHGAPVLCARADPRLHHLAGRAGVTQGYGLAQHHAVGVAPRPGHVPPLHGLLSNAQSEYTQSACRAAAGVSSAFPSLLLGSAKRKKTQFQSVRISNHHFPLMNSGQAPCS